MFHSVPISLHDSNPTAPPPLACSPSTPSPPHSSAAPSPARPAPATSPPPARPPRSPDPRPRRLRRLRPRDARLLERAARGGAQSHFYDVPAHASHLCGPSTGVARCPRMPMISVYLTAPQHTPPVRWRGFRAFPKPPNLARPDEPAQTPPAPANDSRTSRYPLRPTCRAVSPAPLTSISERPVPVGRSARLGSPETPASSESAIGLMLSRGATPDKRPCLVAAATGARDP